jgi:2-polyprenyl-3-methyl-5-hydroxy-6-metoxy-1,4-benzoquinol methylase
LKLDDREETFMPTRVEVRARLKELYKSAPRDVYFEAIRSEITRYYLADPSNPYQQSGRGSGAERWRQTRHCIVQAVHRDGDFLDVGCANGLLLESLIGWAAEGGVRLRPHGIDFVPELIELARERLSQYAGSFEVANAFYWAPSRQFDFVRTNLEYVQPRDWPAFIARQYSAVAEGGRLIVCHYREVEDAVDVGALLSGLGYEVSGHTEAPGVRVAWCDRHVRRRSE